METIKLRTRVDKDGRLRLDIATELPGGEVEVVLVVQAAPPAETDANGWPIGFFARTYGALVDDPIERPPQPPLEQRDAIE